MKLSVTLTALLLATAFITKADDAVEEWKYVGMSYFGTDIPEAIYEGDGRRTFYVRTEESTTRPGVYRLVNPLGDIPLREGVTRTATTTPMLVVHAEDSQKVWFEECDLGLNVEKYGGRVELCSAASLMILEDGATVDEAAAAGVTGKTDTSKWIRFSGTYGDDGRPVMYLRTPRGTVKLNEKSTTAVFQLPRENRLIDVITAETFRTDDGVTQVKPGFFGEAAGTPGLVSPATFHLKNAWKTLEGSIASNADYVQINADGTFTLPYGTEIMNTVTGGKLTRATVIMAEDSECFASIWRTSGSPFVEQTYVKVGTAMVKDGNLYYPYSGTASGAVGEEREDYLLIDVGNKGSKIKRIELEWEFDEGPCATPTATLSDAPDINVTTDLFFACKTLGSTVYYSVDGGEKIEADPATAVNLPWGRHEVKLTARRYRKLDSELTVNYNVFSEPVITTDVIDCSKLPTSGSGPHTVTGNPSGAEYGVKGFNYPNDNYISMYSDYSGFFVSKSAGRIASVEIWQDPAIFANKKQGGSATFYSKEEAITSWPSYWYSGSGLTNIGKLENGIMLADIEAGRPSTVKFTTSPAYLAMRVANNQPLVPTWIKINWIAGNQPCEKIMFPKETEVYDTTPVFLDCLTDGATYNVTVNGESVAYDPEAGLLLPVGTEVTVSGYTSKEGCQDSPVAEQTFHVAPETVAGIAEFISAAETSLPVAIQAETSVVYRNGNEAYLTDGDASIRLIAGDAAAIENLVPGCRMQGVKGLFVTSDTPEMILTWLSDEISDGDAPDYPPMAIGEISKLPAYTPARLENATLAADGDRFVAGAGDENLTVINRYADASRFDAVTVEPEEGRLFNIEGLAVAGYLIATRSRGITHEPGMEAVGLGLEDDHSTYLNIYCQDEDVTIYYSLDGAEFAEFADLVKLPAGRTEVRAYALASGMDESEVVSREFQVENSIGSVDAEINDGETAIYDLSGRRVDTSHPQPGIYVARTANGAFKITVK